MRAIATRQSNSSSPQRKRSAARGGKASPAPRGTPLAGPVVQRTPGCVCDGGCPRCTPVQAKLKVNPPGDRYEQEADRVAEQVMRMPDPGIQRQVEPLADQITPLIQRQVEPEEEWEEEPEEDKEPEEDEPLQTKPLAEQITPLVQRQAEPEEEEEEEVLQRQPETDDLSLEDEDEDVLQRQEVDEDLEEEEEPVQAKPVAGAVPKVSAGLEGRLRGLRGGGAPLPASERDYFEPRLGLDLEPVRVHDSAAEGEMAGDLRARAFTRGSDIIFGAGQYCPGRDLGRRLLAHELVHVAQQTGGQTVSLQRQAAPAPAVPEKLDKALKGDDDAVRALSRDEDWDSMTLTADQAARLMIKLLDGYTGEDDQVAGLKVLYQAFRSNILDETVVRLKQLKALTWMFDDYDGDAYRRLLDFLSRSIKKQEAAGVYLDEFISMTWVREHEERAIVELLDQISEIDVHPILSQKNRESELRKAIDEPIYKKRYESIVEFARPVDLEAILKDIRAGKIGATPEERRAAEERAKKLKAAGAKLLTKALKGDDDDVRGLTKDEAWGAVDFTADQAAQLLILLLDGPTGNEDEAAGLKILAKAKVRDVLDECLLALNSRGKFGQLLDDFDGEEYRRLLDFLSMMIGDVKVKALYLDKFISMNWVRAHEERAIVELLNRSSPDHLKKLLLEKNRIASLREAVDEHIFTRRLEAAIGKAYVEKAKGMEAPAFKAMQKEAAEQVRKGTITPTESAELLRRGRSDLRFELIAYRFEIRQALRNPSLTGTQITELMKTIERRLGDLVARKKLEVGLEAKWKIKFDVSMGIDVARPWSIKELKAMDRWLGSIPEVLLYAYPQFKQIVREKENRDRGGYATTGGTIGMVGKPIYKSTLVHEVGHTIHFDDPKLFEAFQEKSDWKPLTRNQISREVPVRKVHAIDTHRKKKEKYSRIEHGQFFYRYNRYDGDDDFYRYRKNACFITPYAHTDPQDDFAETFEAYMLSHKKLRNKCRDKYDFMHVRVFIEYWLKKQIGKITEQFDLLVSKAWPTEDDAGLIKAIKKRFVKPLKDKLTGRLESVKAGQLHEAGHGRRAKHIPLRGQRLVEPVARPFIQGLTSLVNLVKLILHPLRKVMGGLAVIETFADAKYAYSLDELIRDSKIRLELRDKYLALLAPDAQKILAGSHVRRANLPAADNIANPYLRSVKVLEPYIPRYHAAHEAHGKIFSFGATVLMRRRPSSRRERLRKYIVAQLKRVRSRTSKIKAAIIHRIKAGRTFVARQLMSPARLVRRIKWRIKRFARKVGR